MSVIDVKPVSPQRWREYRAVRLAALAADPDAFGSTLAREEAFPPDLWRERCTNPASFVGYLEGRPVAMAGLIPGEGPQRELVGVWTDPAARGHGVAAEVCRAAIDAAYASGSASVTLWVEARAESARRLYLRLGFVETGRSETMPRDSSLRLIEMELALSQST
ncbi:MAG: GNAT family N-acetyltransferase [Propionibacteriaceae bacterium]|nr:GNAT family N-acetyltransferase [Micropruina sp.]